MEGYQLFKINFKGGKGGTKMNIEEFLRAYYGFIILGVVVILLLFWNFIINRIKRIKKKVMDEPLSPGLDDALFSLEQEGLFEEIQNKDTLNNFQEQRILAEKRIKQIKEEGKKIVRDEINFVNEYRQKKFQFDRERKSLGMKYSIWVNQLKMIDEMIANQSRIRDEFNKLQEDG